MKSADEPVLVLNGGSSSIKFALFDAGQPPRLIDRGTIEAAAGGNGLDEIEDRLATALGGRQFVAVGHRLVHGGPELRDPRRLTPQLTAQLQQLVPFAPNHLPAELRLIEAVVRRWPDVPQVVCFDTAFHSELPARAFELPLARRHAAAGIRRYGFHGLSYTFLMQELTRRAGTAASGRVILAHLGNGSSLAAVRDSLSIDTTMGFTPIGGVVMGTRTGDLDPGIVVQIARRDHMDATALEHELSQESGLLGISGRSADMRELLAHESSDERCRLAVEIYCYEIRKRIGAYAAALGGLDILVFSGGIGEHAAPVRARICDGLAFLGIELDENSNARHAAVISRDTAPVIVHVIPANEELVIAEAVFRLLDDYDRDT